jgi:hypothetical protein
MINDSMHLIQLGPKWQAFFEKHRQRLLDRKFPGLSRTRASKKKGCPMMRLKSSNSEEEGNGK